MHKMALQINYYHSLTSKIFKLLLISISVLLCSGVHSFQYEDTKFSDKRTHFFKFNGNSISEKEPFFMRQITNLPEDSFFNCGEFGNITRISISGCYNTPCPFFAEDVFNLEYDFVPDIAFESLDFRLSLIDEEAEEVFLLRFNRGGSPFYPGELKTSFTVVTLNATIPLDRKWQLEISREFEGVGEICARFDVTVGSFSTKPPATDTTAPTTEVTDWTNVTPIPTTFDPFTSDFTTTITTEMSTSLLTTTDAETTATTSRPVTSTVTTSVTTSVTTETTATPPEEDFECEDVGYFPDPVDCSKYHLCQLYSNDTLWDTVFTCPLYTVWCQEANVCQFPKLCPCEILQVFY